MAKSSRARAQRREAERDAAKLARARIKLAALEPGGAPDRPIDVTSASVVEPSASGQPCAACGAGGVRVEEHAAETVPAEGGAPRALRRVRVKCRQCGVTRDVWFRVGTTLPS
jgi:hypothetical protein